MGDQSPPTVRLEVIPVVLVLGLSEDFLERTRDAAAKLSAIVRGCTLQDLPTMAAKWRPFAIFMPKDLLEFDRPEFKNLARDVNATLIELIDERIPTPKLEAVLRSALADAVSKRKKQGEA